jgi:hypothetical protein
MTNGARGVVRSSTASGNGHGFCAGTPGSVLEVQRSSASHNSGSGIRTVAGTLRVSNSTVTGNGIGLDNVIGSLQTLGNNLVEGNTTDSSGVITVVPGK